VARGVHQNESDKCESGRTMSDERTSGKLSGDESGFEVPPDFPRPPYRSSLSGAQLKLALVEYDGKFYYPGATPPEVWQRWDVCEDLAQQFSRKCLESKAGKRSRMSEEAIIQQYYERLLKTSWVSEPEGAWVMRRAAQLVGWPLPDRLKEGKPS
jgi:hypothetical protein